MPLSRLCNLRAIVDLACRRQARQRHSALPEDLDVDAPTESDHDPSAFRQLCAWRRGRPRARGIVFCSGQLGIGRDGAVPESVEAQARLCFRAIAAILGEAGMTLADIVRINAYVSSAEYLGGYMKVRDEFVGVRRRPRR